MSETHTLPFDLNDESLASWLESISSLSPVNAGSQLNQAITQLRKIDYDKNLVFPLLLRLTPATLHLANALASMLKPGPQKNKSAKIAKLSLQLLRNLSLVFHALLETDQLSVQQKLQGIYFALQLIGQYLRISSLLHELPSETLWNKSGELYVFALDNDGLRQSVASKIQEFKYQSSIEQVIKRNLIFTIAAFHQQSATDNQALYAFSNQYSDLLELANDHIEYCNFIWNYKNGIPHQVQTINRPLQNTEIAIDTSKLLSHLQSDSCEFTFKPHELERLNHFLSGYEQLINDTIPSAPIMFTMLSGFNLVYDFLSNQEKLTRIHKLSAQIPEEKQQDGFSLEPLDYEKSLLSNYAKPHDNAYHQSMPDDSSHNVKILQSKNKNYIHAESKNANWRIGELVLLANKKNAYMAGKILQTKPITNTQSTILLIERIVGTLTTLSLQPNQYKNTTAIAINPESEHPELLLSFEKFRNGTEFQSGNKTIRLDLLLDFSSFFVRYRISF